MYTHTHTHTEARRQFEAAVEGDPQHATAWNNLGHFLRAQQVLDVRKMLDGLQRLAALNTWHSLAALYSLHLLLVIKPPAAMLKPSPPCRTPCSTSACPHAVELIFEKIHNSMRLIQV
jgi:hypothetical protein